MEQLGGFRLPMLKNKVDFKQLKIQLKTHVNFIDADMWSSVTN